MKSHMYKLGIVGYGYVGQGIHRLFEDWVSAIYNPSFPKFIAPVHKDFSYNKKEDFNCLDLIVVSVPTPTSKKDGLTGDFSIMEDTIKWIVKVDPNALILVKSAVVPSEIERMQKKYKARIVISPEYMGEGKYFVPFWKYADPVEMKYHDFQIFGGEKKDTSACVDIFVRKMGPHVDYHQSNLKTAALCKYMENCWGAMKVIFCNEWHEIAKAYGVDYNELRELWTADKRVEKMHTAVFPNKRGYGGKCYPKDIKAIIADCKKQGYPTRVMELVNELNYEFNKLNK